MTCSDGLTLKGLSPEGCPRGSDMRAGPSSAQPPREVEFRKYLGGALLYPDESGNHKSPVCRPGTSTLASPLLTLAACHWGHLSAFVPHDHLVEGLFASLRRGPKAISSSSSLLGSETHPSVILLPSQDGHPLHPTWAYSCPQDCSRHFSV